MSRWAARDEIARGRGGRRWIPATACAAVVAMTVAFAPAAAQGSTPRLTFTPAQALPGAAGGTEPQIAVAPDGTRYAIAAANVTSSSGNVLIYRSPADGGAWTQTAGQMVGVRVASPDVDIVATTTGRLVVVEEDSAALSLIVNYSDNGGRTWKESTGLSQLADEDRPWLAAGPGDVVYLLFHNGFSSNLTQNMFVETSRDGGATFGIPVPITLPGTAAFSDLQCADSGGPSALVVNARTGRLYAVWGTRHGVLGGCGVLPVEPFTLVPADRVWVATSPNGAAGTWQSELAVDDSSTGQVVGMQLSPAALDSAGNLWLAWTLPPQGFPDDSGAGIDVREANPTLTHWSAPRTLVASGGAGHVLAQLVAGAPGNLGLLYLTGHGSGPGTRWFPQASVVTGALAAAPAIATTTLRSAPSYQGTAVDLMGSGCDPSKSLVGTVENNPITCQRSADVIGIGLDRSCRVVVSWPSVSVSTSSYLGVSTDATWIATQSGGSSLCSTDAAVVSPPRRGVVTTGRGTGPESGNDRGTSDLAFTGIRLGALGAVALLLMAAGSLIGWRRRGSDDQERAG